METDEERFIRYADTIVAHSDFNGELSKECLDFHITLWEPSSASLPPDLASIRIEIFKLLPKSNDGETVNIDITTKYIQKNYDIVRNHLLNNGYIDKPDHTNRWILNDTGKLMKRIGSHAKYQAYKKQELDLKWYQTENARLQYEDYPKVQKKASDALSISKLALLISGSGFLLLLIKWIFFGK
ncbi:hypothetical protein BH10BAC2_BH10BAC2_12110 [soil metagenome]